MKQILKILPAILILILGIIISFWIYSIYKKKALSEKENQISTVIENNYRDIQQQLAVSLSSIEILRFIFEEQKDISKEEFKNFTASLLKSNPGIKALSWVPKITNEERAVFENKISKNLKEKIVITKRDSQNEAIANEENPIYFPVTYIEPLNENNKAVGYNIYSDGSRQKTIDLAINKGEIVITPRIKIVQDTLGYSFLGIAPVFVEPENATTIVNAKGLISAVFTLDNLIYAALANSKDPKIAIAIVDVTDNKREFIYGKEALFDKTGQFIEKRMLPFGGRTWEINFIISPVYYQITDIKNYLIGGIAISFLLFMLLMVPVIKERRRIVLSKKLFEEQKERARTQESLSESEEKYRFMFANNPQPMWIFDRETLAFLEINNAAITHYGYTNEEFLSMTIADIRPKEEVAPLLIFLNQQRDVFNFAGEWRHLKKNGEIIIVEITSHEITYNNRQARHVMVNDISERKLAKKKLQESQEYLSIIYNNSEFAILVIEVLNNGEYRFEGCNPRNEELVGIKNEDLVGKTPDELTEYLGTETVNYIKMMYDQCVMTRKSITSEYFIPEGFNKGWWLSTFNPIIDENTDAVVKLIVSGFLITERKQAEENLISSKKQLEFISNHIPVFIAHLDAKKQYKFVNKPYAALFGLRPDDIIGKHANEILGAQGFETANPYMETVLSGQAVNYEFNLPHISNQPKVLSVRYVPEFNESGLIEGFIAAITDITERKKSEGEVKESAANLKSLIDNRNDSIWSLDLDFNFIVFNKFYADAFFEANKFNVEKGMCALDSLNPEAYEFWVPKYKSVFEGEALTFEFNYDFGGKTHYYQVSLNPIHKDNSIIGVSAISIEITDILVAEEELKKRESQLTVIVDSLNEAVIASTVDGNVFLWNNSGLEMFGFSALSEALNPLNEFTKLFEVYTTDGIFIPLENWPLSRILNGEKLSNWEVRLKHLKTGKETLFSYSGSLVYNDVGQALMAVVTVHDITERKKAEEDLKKSEENLRLSTELANVAVWEYDFSTNTMERSKNHDRLYGLSPQPIWQMDTFVNATHPLDREISTGFIQKSVASGGPDKYTFDFRVVFSDKSIHWLNVIGQVMERNPKGEGVIVRGVLMDITDRKKAEEDLKRSEEEFRTLAESMPQIVWITNADGWNIYFNQQWVDYTGLTLEESYGNGWNTPFHPDDQQRAWEAWQNAVCNNGVYSIEARLRRFDGVYRWWLVRGVPILNKKGEIVKWYGTCTDINTFKQVSEEIKILNESLEQRVIERTEQLNAVNKELQTFTYSVSHDLKAPLRGIDGYSNLLQELYTANLNEEARSFISAIRKGTAQMNMLIEDLLEYSRLERATLRIETIKIKTLLETLKFQFKTQFSDSNYTVNINVPDIEITADRKGLTIALRNLIDNAIKFSTKNKKPIVDISLKNKHTFWEIEVKDNGIGFEMKYKDRIFEIFQQLNLPEEFPGTGIGLAMVHKSMEKMGGKVLAESTSGKGATFYLQIPKQ